MHPQMVSALVYLTRDVLDLYETRRETHGSIPRDELISICVKDVLGRSEFDKRSILESEPGMTVPKAATLVALANLGGRGMLGEIVSKLGIPKQTAYARVGELERRGYVTRVEKQRGLYELTPKGKVTAQALSRNSEH